MVRVQIQETLPVLVQQDGHVSYRYVARCEDIEAAEMHLHQCMRHALVDLENRIYRGELERMIACVEADDLDHHRVWLDPAVAAAASQKIESLVAQMRAVSRRNDRIWQGIGIAAILMLLFTAL